MPLKGARYRVVQSKKGPVRLAFKGSEVVEAKNLKTGAMHKEMAADHKRGACPMCGKAHRRGHPG